MTMANSIRNILQLLISCSKSLHDTMNLATRTRPHTKRNNTMNHKKFDKKSHMQKETDLINFSSIKCIKATMLKLTNIAS